ncbi:MAG: hypothetical protein WC384_16890 [Prolixibacteraceae bacterium]|jgi:hypothetical protein
MKLRNFSRLLLFAFVIMCIAPSCVKEGPMGPAGANGTNGTNGTDGTNGADGTAFCLDCHTEAKMNAVQTAWAGSVHATGTAFARASSADCAPCHAAEGFINFIERPTVAAVGITNPSHITCEACHNGMHVTFDVATDGTDYALRTKAAVNVITDPGKTIDLGGEANLCVNCHQSRTPFPADSEQLNADGSVMDAAGNGTYAITSSHYGPHHGPQGNLLVGVGAGYEFTGSANYPASGNTATKHAEVGCTTCHMNSGSHAFTPSLASCTSCHGTLTDFDVNGFQTEIATLLEELKTKMDERGISAKVAAAKSTAPAILSVTEARVFYNYTLIEEDRSEGAHNPKYIKALLQNTIEALN